MVLMYHHVCPLVDIPSSEDPIFEKEGWQYCITPDRFEFQIQFFIRKGYLPVPPDEYIAYIKANGKEHPKHLLVTFDDGWIDNLRHAYPILKKHGVPAMFFVNSDYLENEHDTHRINVSEMLALSNDLITIAAHTHSHKILTRIPLDEVEEELRNNKMALEKITNQPVKYLAYPGGAFNQAIVDTAKQVGFTAAFSTISPSINTSNDLFWLYRNVFSDNMDTLADQYRLSPLLVKLLSFRVKKKRIQKLNAS